LYFDHLLPAAARSMLTRIRADVGQGNEAFEAQHSAF